MKKIFLITFLFLFLLVLNLSFVKADYFDFERVVVDRLDIGDFECRGMFFNGTNWFVTCNGHDTVNVFDLDWNKIGSHSTGTEDNLLIDIYFNGSNWFVYGGRNNTIYVYDSNWNYLDISYPVHNNIQTIFLKDNNWYGMAITQLLVYDLNWNLITIKDLTAQNLAMRGIYFNGTNWFTTGDKDGNTRVYVYDLDWNYFDVSYYINTSLFSYGNQNILFDIDSDGIDWFLLTYSVNVEGGGTEPFGSNSRVCAFELLPEEELEEEPPYTPTGAVVYDYKTENALMGVVTVILCLAIPTFIYQKVFKGK